jgi:hypothetical protein
VRAIGSEFCRPMLYLCRIILKMKTVNSKWAACFYLIFQNSNKLWISYIVGNCVLLKIVILDSLAVSSFYILSFPFHAFTSARLSACVFNPSSTVSRFSVLQSWPCRSAERSPIEKQKKSVLLQPRATTNSFFFSFSILSETNFNSISASLNFSYGQRCTLDVHVCK